MNRGVAVRVLAGLIWLCSASAPAVESETRPEPTPESAFFTESHNAAAVAVVTQNTLVRRVASECRVVLGHPDGWSEWLYARWQARNVEMVRAAYVYVEALLGKAQERGGAAARDAAARELNQTVNGNVSTTIIELLGSADRKNQCEKTTTLIENGSMDITSRFPLYEDMMRIRDAISSVRDDGK